MKKQRLDLLLVEKNLVASRERAKALIMAGVVWIDGHRADKPGSMYSILSDVVVKEDPIGYVSRGGLKLAKALQSFSIDLVGKIVADIGASTGGFTDCALKNGAVKVYAIDVGYGQLAWNLRNDERVVNMERTNIRYLTAKDLNELIDFASIDVSFISLDKVLPAVGGLLAPTASIVALIKPQFEAGREKVGKKGVVKDPIVHIEVISQVVSTAKSLQLAPVDLTFSPITGPEGNIEYLLYLKNAPQQDYVDLGLIKSVVTEAHSNFDK